MDSTKRFSNRVEEYVKYRPDYPVAVIDYLQQDHGLTTNSVIADIGAGTGISTALLLKAGYEVFAVEPNEPMLNKAVELLHHYPGFHAVKGTAEETNLPSQSVDVIVAGQAFHWFNRDKCKPEFKRILRNNGLVVLMWNERKTTSAFEVEYDALIVQHAIDYVKVDHRNIDDEKMGAFFSPAPFQLEIFPNKQVFDFNGLKGRLQSSSYVPSGDDPGFPAMIDDLQLLFNKYQENGYITIHYDTKVYTSRW